MRLSLAAGDDWSVNHFPTVPHCVILCASSVCVSGVVKHELEDEEREHWQRCMVIRVEELMESGPFFCGAFRGAEKVPAESFDWRTFVHHLPFNRGSSSACDVPRENAVCAELLVFKYHPRLESSLGPEVKVEKTA